MSAEESFNEDDLYAAMDQLTGRWVTLEKQLYERAFPQSVRLVLYDLTSVYFEGDGPAHLARYGHSRDHRGDRGQIMLAVATETEGVPIHLQLTPETVSCARRECPLKCPLKGEAQTL